jgi:hypothetical protein
MPESRKRAGHHYRKPSDIPARQRTKGRIVWALLFSAFGVMIAYFAAGDNYIALAVGVVIGGVLGFVIGRAMEADAKK